MLRRWPGLRVFRVRVRRRLPRLRPTFRACGAGHAAEVHELLRARSVQGLELGDDCADCGPRVVQVPPATDVRMSITFLALTQLALDANGNSIQARDPNSGDLIYVDNPEGYFGYPRCQNYASCIYECTICMTFEVSPIDVAQSNSFTRAFEQLRFMTGREQFSDMSNTSHSEALNRALNLQLPLRWVGPVTYKTDVTPGPSPPPPSPPPTPPPAPPPPAPPPAPPSEGSADRRSGGRKPEDR